MDVGELTVTVCFMRAACVGEVMGMGGEKEMGYCKTMEEHAICIESKFHFQCFRLCFTHGNCRRSYVSDVEIIKLN
jgi:hypothetical protein